MSQQTLAAGTGAAAAGAGAAEARAYRKVFWRIIPFLMLCYLVAYLDRVNVGFAKLQMRSDCGFSETVFGLGAGHLLHRLLPVRGAEQPDPAPRRRARLDRPHHGHLGPALRRLRVRQRRRASFYVLRFLLGVAEAGFFPGIILYLTYWFPRAPPRAR